LTVEGEELRHLLFEVREKPATYWRIDHRRLRRFPDDWRFLRLPHRPRTLNQENSKEH